MSPTDAFTQFLKDTAPDESNNRLRDWQRRANELMHDIRRCLPDDPDEGWNSKDPLVCAMLDAELLISRAREKLDEVLEIQWEQEQAAKRARSRHA